MPSIVSAVLVIAALAVLASAIWRGLKRGQSTGHSDRDSGSSTSYSDGGGSYSDNCAGDSDGGCGSSDGGGGD